MPLQHVVQRYRPRDPTRGVLYRVVKRNLDPFLEVSEGRLPRHVERAFRKSSISIKPKRISEMEDKFLDCGV
ncbi:MAG TPA: hypothetical protein VI643_01565, partial [Planctomycetota bacterium]|nr:hypothetical protein [Planctomycetota bacterium]